MMVMIRVWEDRTGWGWQDGEKRTGLGEEEKRGQDVEVRTEMERTIRGGEDRMGRRGQNWG